MAELPFMCWLTILNLRPVSGAPLVLLKHAFGALRNAPRAAGRTGFCLIIAVSTCLPRNGKDCAWSFHT